MSDANEQHSLSGGCSFANSAREAWGTVGSSVLAVSKQGVCQMRGSIHIFIGKLGTHSLFAIYWCARNIIYGYEPLQILALRETSIYSDFQGFISNISRQSQEE